MNWINIEIKAHSSQSAQVIAQLQKLSADFRGEDHQIDTYFNVPTGRLKLRQGNIENALIHYNRTNQEGPKTSEITYYRPKESQDLKATLTAALGVLVVVDKKRKIFFIDNVKFHVDEVKDLGQFVEIEAIDKTGTIGKEKLHEQCQYYMNLFAIKKTDLIAVSYSDLLLRKI
jgi:predicted adenylyl cyclase CyaB